MPELELSPTTTTCLKALDFLDAFAAEDIAQARRIAEGRHDRLLVAVTSLLVTMLDTDAESTPNFSEPNAFVEWQAMLVRQFTDSLRADIGAAEVEHPDA